MAAAARIANPYFMLTILFIPRRANTAALDSRTQQPSCQTKKRDFPGFFATVRAAL
jgi:hypothetical protein